MTDQVRSFSFGGGMQSTAALVLAAQGKIDFPLFIFANVGEDSEKPATLRYVEEYAKPYALLHGIELVEVRRGGVNNSLMHKMERLESSLPIPVRYPSGAPARRSCTQDFKITAIDRELKARGATKDNPAIVGLGITMDEIERMRSEFDPRQPVQRRHYPLIDMKLYRQDCERIIRDEGLPLPSKSACWFCLTGDTEVVTREGVRPISELVGEQNLLVPTAGRLGGLSSQGRFFPATVRSFGVQPVWEVKLRRGRWDRTIRCTGEHRWYLAPEKQWLPSSTRWRTTADLLPGDKLHSIKAVRPTRETPSPFGIAEGFTYGDGTIHQGERPVSLRVYANAPKDQAILPYFQMCGPRLQGDGDVWVNGLPRTWKSLPTLNESRAFLLGWLAGYFAADGSVSKVGQATIESADKEAIGFVRDACAIIGVGTGKIGMKVRTSGFNDGPLYKISLDALDLPESFWVLPEHRKRAGLRRQPAGAWTVVGISATGVTEEVFCATVPEVGAFALDGGLMTGNCPYTTLEEWRRMRRNEPDLFEQACSLEEMLSTRRKKRGMTDVFLTDKGAAMELPLRELVGDDNQMALFEDDAMSSACDGGYCMV